VFPVPTDRLLDLVGLIYDCAVAPELWPAALEAMRTEMRFATAALNCLDFPTGRISLSVTSGIAPDWIERMSHYGAEVVDLWGTPKVVDAMPVGEPGVLSQINPRAFSPPANRYITEWGLPQGLVDSMAMTVVRDGASFTGVGFGRHAAEGPICNAEVVFARQLAPHLRRSITIGRLLNVAPVATAFGAVIDRLAVPVILVAQDRRVLHLNAAALALLQGGAALSSHGSRLTSPEPAAARLLREAVDRCARDEVTLTQGASGFPVRGRDGQVHAVHVLPLKRGRVRSTLAHPAVAAVLVSQPTTWAGGVTDAVAALFGLTSAEARVFGLMGSGMRSAEAAATLGVAPSTLKTHRLRVFDKVGVHRQFDLMQLAARLTSPLAEQDLVVAPQRPIGADTRSHLC
jgi:DNA-binding CsgD family transcriptional regulator